MARLLVNHTYYVNFGGKPIDVAEFNALSQRAEIVCERYVFTRMNVVVKNRFAELVDSETNDYKDAICLQIEMLSMCNGIHAVAGAGDSNSDMMFEGVPFSSLARHKIEMFLQDNNLLLR